MASNNAKEKDGQPPVTFSIDGIEYTVEDRSQEASALLDLAGVDPADHDLARVHGQGQVEKRFKDNETVQLTPGAKFVTVFTGATPVV